LDTKINLWTITDGSQGMISQANGLAQFMLPVFTEKKIKLKWPWSFVQPGIIPFTRKIFNSDFFKGSLPNISISCGRKSVYASIQLKKILKDKITTIHIQNPKINIKKFDYVISPNHDNLKGDNVINSVGALHHLTYSKIKNSKTLFEIPKNKIILTIILGGENNHYTFNSEIFINFLKKINNLNKDDNKYYFLFICSRRTNNNFIKIINEKFKNNCFVWDKKNTNPYLYSLKLADFIIITSDSTSMVSEASITGKPVYVFHLPFKRKSKRFEYFHKEFEQKGITKPFKDTLYSWSYKSLNESERIAGILNTKILK